MTCEAATLGILTGVVALIMTKLLDQRLHPDNRIGIGSGEKGKTGIDTQRCLLIGTSL